MAAFEKVKGASAAKVVWGVWLCALVFFVGARLTVFSQERAGLLEPGSLLFLGVLFDVAVASFVAVMAALSVALLKRHSRLASAWVFALVWSAVWFVAFDLVFYEYSGIHFSKSFWSYFTLKNLYYIRASVFDQLARPRTLLTLIALLVAMTAHFKLLHRWVKQSAESRSALLAHGALALVIGLAANSMANVRQAGLLRHRSGIGRHPVIVNLSQLGETVEGAPAPSDDEIQEIWRVSGLDRRYSFVSKEYPWARRFDSSGGCERSVGQGAKKKNLLFIVLESYGAVSTTPLSPYYKNTTPEFASLSKQGVLFRNAYMNAIPTAPALVSTLCSVYDLQKITDSGDGHQLRCGASILREAGYRTGFIVGTPIDFDGKRRFLGQNGFMDLIGDESFKLTPSDPHHDGQFGLFNDEEAFREAMGWLDARSAAGEPFFLTLLTASTHDPFPQHGEFENVEGAGKRRALHSSMRYTDRELGRFLRELRKKPYFDDTVIFIFGDHPAWFSEKGDTTPGRDDPFLNSRIPLLILNPVGLKPGTVNDWVVSQVDFMPTALEMLGQCKDGAFVGNSLLSPDVRPEDRFAFVNAGHYGRFLLATDRYGVSWHPSYPPERLFDLRRRALASSELTDPALNSTKASLVSRLRTFEKVAEWSIEANRFWNSKVF